MAIRPFPIHRPWTEGVFVLALLAGCGGGGTSPTGEVPDPTGLWDVTMTVPRLPGDDRPVCVARYTMNVIVPGPSPSPDDYIIPLPGTIDFLCGDIREPWNRHGSVLLVRRVAADSLHLLSAQGDTLVRLKLSATSMRGTLDDALPSTPFTATRHAGTDPNLRPTFIQAGPQYGYVDVGDSVTAAARVDDDYGQPVTTPVHWSSSAPDIASITDAGLIHGLRPGTVSITATIDTLTASAPLEVGTPPASVTIADAPDTVPVNLAVVLTGVAFDGGGGVLPGRRFVWTSSDPAIAAVSPYVEGTTILTPIAPGTVTIIAREGAASASATITIVPAGQ
jgi:hypothetical protein